MVQWFCAALLCVATVTAQAATVLVFGDSLSAAYGIGAREGWVTLLEERLKREKFDYSVVNASISGETTSGGAARIEEALSRTRPALVIVALGGNDGLRGLPIAQMKASLSRIVESAQRRGARVLLAGMRMPPNYGPQYTREFEAAFADVARRHKVPLVPFLLQGVADRRELMQPDNIHPTAAAQPLMLETVWKGLRPLLKKPGDR
ncbi:MAG: arylesterase [Betaproteobacteria bacterium RIFCSPLOWO2_02_FULL_67_26]|nr:MAG: arylesterase [Betaproteobacteria bacterium RIFCSPLOWO2_02_FULL_67_26]